MTQSDIETITEKTKNEQDRIIESLRIRSKIAYGFAIVWFILGNLFIFYNWNTTGYGVMGGTNFSVPGYTHDILDLILSFILLGIIPSATAFFLGQKWKNDRIWFQVVFSKLDTKLR